jgi:hypothetical protein
MDGVAQPIVTVNNIRSALTGERVVPMLVEVFVWAVWACGTLDRQG